MFAGVADYGVYLNAAVVRIVRKSSRGLIEISGCKRDALKMEVTCR